MSVLAAIAVLAVLIVVHELGHFVAARSQGIHVNRFSLGFGPVLFKYQGSETEYAVRAFPLGGFVGFPDDDPDSKIPPNDPDLLRNRPVIDRAIVISAGVIANLIFAYLLLVTHIGFFGVPQTPTIKPGVLVPELSANVSRVATEAGIKPGDVILAVNDRTFDNSAKEIEALSQIIKTSAGQPLQLKIERAGEQLTVKVTPEAKTGDRGSIGIALAPNVSIERTKVGLLAAFSAAATEFQRIVVLTVNGFGQLIGNFSETASQISGPVAIVDFGAKIARSDAANLLQFAALISINLAVINTLPLPALDGGQLAFLLFEAVRGKPLPTHIQDGVMQTGLMLLLGLGIFLIVRDTANLEWVQRLFQ